MSGATLGTALAVRRRRAGAGHTVGEEVGDELRARRAEAVERGVAGEPDRVGAEQPGHRCDLGRVDGAGLEAVVERVQEVHRRCAAEREEVARHERLGGQPGQRRVDGVAPAEGAELLAGELQDASARVAGVERGGGLLPRSRRVLVAVDRRVDEAAAGERRQVGDRQQDDDGRQDRPPRHPAAEPERSGGVDEGTGAEGQSEHEHRHGTRRRAQGQGGAGLAVAAEQAHQRRRVVDRVDADGEHDADRHEEGGEAAVGPAGGDDPDERDDQQHEPGDDDASRDHVVASGRRRRVPGVAHVGQPVAEVAPHLGRRRRVADRVQRLAVGQHVGAEPALDRHRDDPPQRHDERQAADAQRRRRGPAAT